MCILITSLTNSKKYSVITLCTCCLPLKGNLDGQLGRQLCWIYFRPEGGWEIPSKESPSYPKNSTSARLLRKKNIPRSLTLVQLHVVNVLWQVFTIPFVCFLWIFRRIMFDERDSVPNPCANMYLCQKYLHGDLESWDFSRNNRVNPSASKSCRKWKEVVLPYCLAVLSSLV